MENGTDDGNMVLKNQTNWEELYFYLLLSGKTQKSTKIIPEAL